MDDPDICHVPVEPAISSCGGRACESVALIVNGLPAAVDRYEQPSEADVHAATSSKLARAFNSAPSARIIVRAAARQRARARGDEGGVGQCSCPP